MKLLKAFGILLTALVIVGCEETEDGNQPTIDESKVYTLGQCKYSVRADDSVIDDIMDFDNNSQDPFYQFVTQVACNPNTIATETISLHEFVDSDGNTTAFINEGEDEVKGLVYRLSLSEYPFFVTGAQNYQDLELFIRNWDSDGITYDGRIIGNYLGIPFDIIFSMKNGWKNEGFFVRKQVVSDGSGFNDANFDLTVSNRNAFFESDFISTANRNDESRRTDFHDVVFSYCDLNSAEKYPFFHNSSLNLGGGIGSDPVTSRYGSVSYNDNYNVRNLEVTVNGSGNVRFDYDLIDINNQQYDNQVLTCYLPN